MIYSICKQGWHLQDVNEQTHSYEQISHFLSDLFKNSWLQHRHPPVNYNKFYLLIIKPSPTQSHLETHPILWVWIPQLPRMSVPVSQDRSWSELRTELRLSLQWLLLKIITNIWVTFEWLCPFVTSNKTDQHYCFNQKQSINNIINQLNKSIVAVTRLY